MQKNLKFSCLKIPLVISTFCTLLFFLSNISFAQDATTTKQHNKATTSEESNDIGVINNIPAYKVLGRKLTPQEKTLYGNLDADELKNQLLYKEQTLVIVRALLVIGESKEVKEILEILPNTKLKTFSELVNDFIHYKEKYGSVFIGVQSEFVYSIKDDEKAFENAAAKAYESVFGIKKEQQNTQSILNFLKAKEAFTYSKMISTLVETLTPEDKKKMLFKALDSIKRPDLKSNEKFVIKILEQTFTHETLMKLLEQINSNGK